MRTDFVNILSAASIASRLTRWEQEERGSKMLDARSHVAREAGLAPGTLHRLAGGTLKYPERCQSKLHALLIRTLERKIRLLERELFLARMVNRPVDLARVEDALAEARRALGK